VKPCDSAGTVGVYMCENIKQVIKYANLLLNNTNIFGEIINEILVME